MFRYEAEGHESAFPLYDTDLPYEDIHAMCDLDQDHEGKHQFVRQSEIELVFS